MRQLLTPLLVMAFLVTPGRASQEVRDTLIVGYTTAPPFINLDNEELSGINIWLWRKVAEDIGLNYRLERMGFGEMLDSLRTGAIDVSINPLTITSSRSRDMEFTHSYYAANSTVAISELSSVQKIIRFLRGFLNSNLLRGIGILLIIILLFGMAGWYFEKRANPSQFRKGYPGLWDGLWWSVVTLTTVGYGDKSPKTVKGKLAALLLMFTGLLFISGLTASIASSLTVDRLSGQNESFSAFKERKVGTVRNTGSAEFLRERFFRDITYFDGVSEGLHALRKNKIEAFMYDEPLLRYRIKQDSAFSKIAILPIRFDVQFYAFGVRKDAVDLEQQITQKILEIIESSQWNVLLNEYGLSEL